MKSSAYQELAEALSPEQRAALQIVKGQKSASVQQISNEALIILRELALIRIERNAEDRDFLELTMRGRHTAEFV